MNLKNIRTLGDCRSRLEWCKAALANKIREGESGQKILRAEIKILTVLLGHLEEPELFQPKLILTKQMKPKIDMKNTTKQYRQGDVFIERVEGLIAGLTKQKTSSKVILAHGELTGHHHSFDAAVVDEYRSQSGDQFFQVHGKPFKISLRILRDWKNQVLVKHPTLGLIEFAKSDISVEEGVAWIDGDFALLKHQEHAAQGIPAGFYRGGVEGKVRQREYSPREIRNVQD
jgi:hypothetical protein